MTNAEKIIADLIDQQKITGEQAVELIKNLKKEDSLTLPYQIWTNNKSNQIRTYNTNYAI